MRAILPEGSKSRSQGKCLDHMFRLKKDMVVSFPDLTYPSFLLTFTCSLTDILKLNGLQIPLGRNSIRHTLNACAGAIDNDVWPSVTDMPQQMPKPDIRTHSTRAF